MRKFLGLLSIVTLISAPVVLGMAQNASATTWTWGHVSVVGALDVPNINIKPNKKGVAEYNPRSLAVAWSGPLGGTCTSSNATFTVTNTTTVSETMVSMRTNFVRIPAGVTVGICAFGSGANEGAFGLTKSGGVLTVHVS